MTNTLQTANPFQVSSIDKSFINNMNGNYYYFVFNGNKNFQFKNIFDLLQNLDYEFDVSIHISNMTDTKMKSIIAETKSLVDIKQEDNTKQIIAYKANKQVLNFKILQDLVLDTLSNVQKLFDSNSSSNNYDQLASDNLQNTIHNNTLSTHAKKTIVDYSTILRFKNITSEDIRRIENIFSKGELKVFHATYIQNLLHTNFINPKKDRDFQYSLYSTADMISEYCNPIFSSSTSEVINTVDTKTFFMGVSSANNTALIKNIRIGSSFSNHMLVAGTTAVGKTRLVTQELYQAVKQNIQVIILSPKAEDYLKLPEQLGGKNITLNEDCGINVFDFEIFSETQILEIIKLLITQITTAPASDSQTHQISGLLSILKVEYLASKKSFNLYNKIVSAFKKDEELKIFTHIFDKVGIMKLISNPKDNISIEEIMIRFDLSSLPEKQRAIFMFILANILDQKLSKTSKYDATFLVLDEAWQLFRLSPTIVSDWLRVMRSSKTSVIIITQTIPMTNEYIQDVWGMVKHKILFQQELNADVLSIVPDKIENKEIVEQIKILPAYNYMYIEDSKPPVSVKSYLSDTIKDLFV